MSGAGVLRFKAFWVLVNGNEESRKRSGASVFLCIRFARRGYCGGVELLVLRNASYGVSPRRHFSAVEAPTAARLKAGSEASFSSMT